MDRQEAELRLKVIFGFDRFHDKQWEVIRRLLEGERVLLIEKTGFGKSLCYQFPATQFYGVTVVFTALIALMRDQIASLQRKNIEAGCINSEHSSEENEGTIQKAIEGRLSVLYIAPERMENPAWIEATRRMNLAMVVIDEAHTISVWGHDFRPAFRRIINLVQQLPSRFPVLATTATATKRVEVDIRSQITGDVTLIRGQLVRENFRLYALRVTSEEEKMLWLAEQLQQIDGTGLIYTGTRVNSQVYARWLQFLGVPAVEYNAGLGAETRMEIEKGLMQNRWKAVVSTNALGMGIDKQDIRFIIHTQIPASPIHYYQEIGRAGRDGRPAQLVVLYNSKPDEEGVPEDYKLPRSFIDGAKPDKELYQKVILALQAEPLGEKQLMMRTNLRQQQVRIIKADLVDQGIIREVRHGNSRKYEYQYGAPELDTKGFEELRQQKLEELDAMIDYVNTKGSRMKFLCDYLGDDSKAVYTNCDNTSLTPLTLPDVTTGNVLLAAFRESFFPVLEVEIRASRLINGVAASHYGTTSVGYAIRKSKYQQGGDFPDFLLNLVVKAFRHTFSKYTFDLMVYVPPTESGDLVKNFAIKLSQRLGIPLSHQLIKNGVTEPQKVFQNRFLKTENVRNKFVYQQPAEIRGKTILLFDDVYDSGATVKEIGRTLAQLGANLIAPLVIARTVGGDL